MIPTFHPYWQIREMLEFHPSVISVFFSYYSYVPRAIEDPRYTHEIPISDFLDPDYMDRFMRTIPYDHELALQSNLRLRGQKTAHLVMIDMATTARAHLEKLRTFLGENIYQKIVWYSSGRSFHGYGAELLSEDNWYKFMGLLLLANQPHLGPTVDPRWIGHRLLAGYAALRWTKNTHQYLRLPSRLDFDMGRFR